MTYLGKGFPRLPAASPGFREGRTLSRPALGNDNGFTSLAVLKLLRFFRSQTHKLKCISFNKEKYCTRGTGFSPGFG